MNKKTMNVVISMMCLLAFQGLAEPTQTAYTNNLLLTQFNVTLTPTEPPLYMIVDLTKSAGDPGQIEYVYESALTNNVWGDWVRNPVTNRGTVVESVIWTGVAADNAYKTDKLVLRRIPAGSFYLGDDDGTQSNNVTLTNEMYVGVFEVTQQQWNLVMGTTGGAATQAKHTVSYYQIRENPTNIDDPAVNWPWNTAVNDDSFMGKLRTKTGISDFDLPTEAQWEYLCRAKTKTVFNDGNTDAVYSVPGTSITNNGNTNDFLNALGWYKYNNPGFAAQLVGGKLPNAWGLYDTHGNVMEWCLDWSGTAGTGTDPVGSVSGPARVYRGGSWLNTASDCRSAGRNSATPSYQSAIAGFRLVRTKSQGNADTYPFKMGYLETVSLLLKQKWPANRSVTIVCHGHSVPAGYFKTPVVDSPNAYPHLLFMGLKERFPYAVVNVIVSAIGGETSDTGSVRFDNDVLSHNPDVVTLDYGLNDRGLGLEKTRTNLVSMIRKAQERGVFVILLTPTAGMNAELDNPNDPLNQQAALIRSLASEYHVGLVDSLAEFMTAMEEGIPLDALMSQSNHPNRKGHDLVVKRLLEWFPE